MPNMSGAVSGKTTELKFVQLYNYILTTSFLFMAHLVGAWMQLTQRVHWDRPSAALEGWGFVCSTFPSQMPLAWRPLPGCRSQSCRGRSHRSLDTQWSSCSGKFGLTDTEEGTWLMFSSTKGSQYLCFVLAHPSSAVGKEKVRVSTKEENTNVFLFVCFACFSLSSCERHMWEALRPLTQI